MQTKTNGSYNKYRTLLLPKPMVDLLMVSSNISPLETLNQTEISIGLSVINDILTKSNIYKENEGYPFHVIPMYSKYLQVKYGNDYSKYIHWLVNQSVIWNDLPFEGYSSHYYLHSIDTCDSLILHKLSQSDMSLIDILNTYCLKSNIQITLQTIDIKRNITNQKNRIYTDWYKIKIPIDSKNKRYLTKDYEEDSVFINNAPKHIKQMGSYYRKNLDIDEISALEHANDKYATELSLAKTLDEESKAFRRYSSRILSINSIKNGRTNKSLRFKRNHTNNRLDTNLTNMARDLRCFIVGYENMAYIDLSNSQPVLFNKILQTYRKDASNIVKMELDKYLKITASGKWYEELMRVYNLKYGDGEELTFDDARDLCKKVWMLIAYSKNNQQQKLKRVFAMEYPFVYNVIKSIKKNNYAQFAITLQKIESNVFIDIICKQLVAEGIMTYTMHDALLVPKHSIERTKQIMLEKIKDIIGVYPTVEIE